MRASGTTPIMLPEVVHSDSHLLWDRTTARARNADAVALARGELGEAGKRWLLRLAVLGPAFADEIRLVTPPWGGAARDVGAADADRARARSPRAGGPTPCRRSPAWRRGWGG